MTGSFPSDDEGTSSERVDALFEALADEHRRQVLWYFQTTDTDVASVEALVDYALERENTPPSRERLVRLFHHSTLPKLAAMDFVGYDVHSQTVNYRGSPALERILTVATETDLVAE
ncbi:DUF7344 domain-containing protein [Haloterrigena alkaliphila]|uniref:DUF7344 domain-containing protein n=1 Tax=Haloterrigena alkaliphila TaxID=2816475 RepID=A0A8A2VAA4_9EURY|nr:hypothetical protein [Haloterrigena alkaliphila]QSW98411.1 hypothetical protein J0X25_13525 [Haloterrigena alkaliphila]